MTALEGLPELGGSAEEVGALVAAAEMVVACAAAVTDDWLVTPAVVEAALEALLLRAPRALLELALPVAADEALVASVCRACNLCTLASTSETRKYFLTLTP